MEQSYRVTYTVQWKDENGKACMTAGKTPQEAIKRASRYFSIYPKKTRYHVVEMVEIGTPQWTGVANTMLRLEKDLRKENFKAPTDCLPEKQDFSD